MNFKLIPRFYYTLPFFTYFNLWKRKNMPEKHLLSNISTNLWFNNSRVGLRLLLSSISEKKLRVGVQAYTCHTIFQSISKAGHIPVFLDLTDDFKLDLNDLKKRIDKIDVLIVTHTFGFPDNLDAIKKIAEDKIIIEDCAHSFLSKYKDSYTGTLGDAAIYSTGLAKFPSIGNGGFCIVNTAEKFPLLQREYDKIERQGSISFMLSYLKMFIFSILLKAPMYGLVTYKLGKKMDKKMDLGNKFSFEEFKGHSWSQRILMNNVLIFNKLLLKQINNATMLTSLLNIKKGLLFDTNDENAPNCYIFPILTANRDKLFDVLLENNIEPGKHFHKSLEWASEFGYKHGDCPNSEKLIDQIITVPVHRSVHQKSIIKIAKILNEHNH